MLNVKLLDKYYMCSMVNSPIIVPGFQMRQWTSLCTNHGLPITLPPLQHSHRLKDETRNRYKPAQNLKFMLNFGSFMIHKRKFMTGQLA